MSSWEKEAHRQAAALERRRKNPLKEAWQTGFQGDSPLGDYTPEELASYNRGWEQRLQQKARHMAGDFSYRPERYDY